MKLTELEFAALVAAVSFYEAELEERHGDPEAKRQLRALNRAWNKVSALSRR